MAHSKETILSVVASGADRRVVIALLRTEPQPIVVRVESFSPDVGWFAQQTLRLTRQELQGLKSVLGVQLPRACETALAAVEGPTHELVDGQTPRRHILSFAEAHSRRA